MGRFVQGDIHHSKVGIGLGFAALIQMMEETKWRGEALVANPSLFCKGLAG